MQHNSAVSAIVVLFVSLCLAEPQNANATAVAVLMTKESIVIAADSAAVGTINGIAQAIPPVCKIRQMGGFFFTAAGRLESKTVGFTVWDIARQEAAKRKDLFDTMNAIERALSNWMPRVIDVSRVESPKQYRKWTMGDPVLSVLLTTFNGDTPIAVWREFHIDNAGNALPPIGDVVRRNQGSSVVLTMFGHTMAMKKFIAEHLEWSKRGADAPAEVAFSLIESEIRASEGETVREVGLPVSILVSEKNDAHWAPDHQGLCEDITEIMR